MVTIIDAIAELAGSVGDTTYARNPYGPYERPRTTPTNLRTALQMAVRREWARTQYRWAHTLTAGQRKLWHDYAAQYSQWTHTPRPEVLRGMQAYMRVNVPRASTPLGYKDSPPTQYRQSEWHEPIAVLNFGGGVIYFTLRADDEWRNQDYAGMWVSVSDGWPATKRFFKGPFRRAKLVLGSQSSPPALSQTATDPFGVVTKPNRWIRTAVYLADGRTTKPRIRPFDTNP